MTLSVTSVRMTRIRWGDRRITSRRRPMQCIEAVDLRAVVALFSGLEYTGVG